MIQGCTSASCVIRRFVDVLFDVQCALVVKDMDGGSLDMIDWYLFGKVCWDTDWCCDCLIRRVEYMRGPRGCRCRDQGWYLVEGSWI